MPVGRKASDGVSAAASVSTTQIFIDFVPRALTPRRRYCESHCESIMTTKYAPDKACAFGTCAPSCLLGYVSSTNLGKVSHIR